MRKTAQPKMDQWLDSLSEDWVSQPRSPHSSSILRESQSRDSPSPGSNGSQSRIPRYKPRSTSSISTASTKAKGCSTVPRRSSQVDVALREKTSSNLNASQKRNGNLKARGSNAVAMRLHGRAVSTGSVPGAEDGTVQHKSSPAKTRDMDGTPDWKRKLLKENARGDLFSPIGLESVFRPPTVKGVPQDRFAGKKKLPENERTQLALPQRPLLADREHQDLASSPSKPAPTPPNKAVIPSDAKQSASKNPERKRSRNGSQQADDILNKIDGIHHTSQTLLNGTQSKSSALPAQHLPDGQCSVSTEHAPRITSLNSISEGPISDKSCNEEISLLYVSRKNTVDGRVEYAAVDASVRKLRSQMDKMRLQQESLPPSRSSDNGIDYVECNPSKDSIVRHDTEVTSQSLPEDLSMGTDAYAANGGFISVQRGGYSNNGSFQRRPISPSLLADLDGPSLRVLSSTDNEKAITSDPPHNFSQTKSRTPSSPPPSPLPQTPRNRNINRSGSDDRPRSSGSPLKLFDKYDTFTNERLIRRMSKFEESLQQEVQDNQETINSTGMPSSPSPRRRRPHKQQQSDSLNETASGSRMSSFGDGKLNEYRFVPDQDLDPVLQGTGDNQQQTNHFRSLLSASHHNQSDTAANRSGSRQKPSNNQPRKTQEDGSDSDGTAKLVFEASRRQNPFAGQEDLWAANGKRSLVSPAKDPAPKRRRTLISSEAAQANNLRNPSMLGDPVRPISGRKRKDARYDADRQTADPDTLAMRPIRQLKGRLMSQLGNPDTTTQGDQAGGEQDSRFLPHEDWSNPKVDPPTQIVAGALATVALNTAQEVTYGSRKASVTTADFFNEAQQIMQLIRAKGRPRSSRTTTGGSEDGHPIIEEESFVGEITKDEFSRPPSREGKADHLEESKKMDARIVSHLRRFEDDQDLGLALSSSLKTLEMNQANRKQLITAVDDENLSDAGSGAESDPPNIRIRESIIQNQKRKHSSSIQDSSNSELEAYNRSRNFQPASGSSSGRSNPTGSSHSSTNRMIIAPETVAHLLSDQMAGMVFDRQRQLWVKRKSSRNVESNDQQDHVISAGTEEDLFGDIPDLSVDEMEELQRVKDAVSSVKSVVSSTNKVSVRDPAVFTEGKGKVMDHADEAEHIRPRTAEGKSIPPIDDSSAPSKFSHFTSSGPQPGTRATSWGDDILLVKGPPLPKSQPQPDIGSLEHQDEEQVEHEISILEGRQTHQPKHKEGRKHQARVVTVAFSSPLVDHRSLDFGQVDDTASEGESVLTLDDSPIKHSSESPVPAGTPSRSGRPQDGGRRSARRRMSMNHQSYLARPMSRLDEEDEMSLVHCSSRNHRVNIEVAFVTPIPRSKSLMIPPSTNRRSSVGFHLSPLPDFTIHQVDKPIDGNSIEVSKRLSQDNVDNRLSLAAQDLVKNLTDLEPYEPYWDYIRRVDLRGRDLGTLHMLSEFCGRLEELDVSDNQIRDLNGIPDTVRELDIRSNCLSDLVAWDPLRNLQYLDVSYNQIPSLHGFQSLVHLRSLKANGNEIDSISGIEHLNGLTELSLRSNKVREVNFETFNL